MAGSAVIGALRVNLSADSAAFSNGLKKADASLSRFGANVARAAAAVAATMAVALAGLAVGMKRAIDQADKMSKMAQSVGVPVEELSRLAHAADLSGVSLETMATSLGRLSRGMSEVAAGAKNDTAKAFAALRIAVKNTDGTLRSNSDVMADVADRFAQMPNGARKTALAMQIFGRAGAGLIPLLNAGRDGLNEMMREADALGLTLDQKTASAAERFNDNLSRLGKIKDGIILKLTAQLLPAFERFSQRLVDAAINGQWVEKVSAVLSRVLDGLAVAINVVYQNFGHLLDFFKVFIAAKMVVYVTTLGSAFIGWARTVRAAGLAMWAVTSITKIKITTIVLLAAAIAKLTGTYETLVGWVEEFGRKVVNALPKEITDGLASLSGELGGLLGVIDDANERLTGSLSGGVYYAEKFEDSFAGVGAAGKKMAIDLGEGVNETTAAFDRMKGTIQSIGFTIETSLGRVFDTVVDGTFNARAAIGDLLKDLGRLLVNSAFQQLIGAATGAIMPGGGAPAANLVPSPNLRPPGFATGGSFRVGGAGGIDSSLIAFRATPGEMVDIRRPGDDRGEGGNMNLSIVVSGNGDKELMANMEAGARRIVSQALGQYDRSLPGRVGQIKQAPRKR
jgi:hypothetical protein